MRDEARAFHLCLSCTLTLLVLAALIVASFAYLHLGLERLLSAAAVADMRDFIASFFPPDVSVRFLRKVAYGVVETLAISAVGTLLAVLFGLALALPASGRYGRALRAATRFVLNLLRSIPELVWATLMVLAAGLGPFAGTLALGMHTSGVLGRLFADALENMPEEPSDALRQSGAPRAFAFLYGTLPGVLPQFISYTLYRWEMNIRMAAILGFVGAGGLGQLLYYELSLLHQPQVCSVIVAMLLLTLSVDLISAKVRRGLGRTYA
jgi:phosphonate transport system permease protein